MSLRRFISEKSEWKYDRSGDYRGKEDVSNAYVAIGSMHLNNAIKEFNMIKDNSVKIAKIVSDVIPACKSAIKYNPESIGAYGLLGLAYLSIDKYVESLIQLNIALSKNGADNVKLDCHFFKGMCYENMNKLEDAISSLSEAIALNPQNERAIQELVRIKQKPQ